MKILEAKDLKKADIGITGKGKSDPYVIIKGKILFWKIKAKCIKKLFKTHKNYSRHKNKHFPIISNSILYLEIYI